MRFLFAIALGAATCQRPALPVAPPAPVKEAGVLDAGQLDAGADCTAACTRCPGLAGDGGAGCVSGCKELVGSGVTKVDFACLQSSPCDANSECFR